MHANVKAEDRVTIKLCTIRSSDDTGETVMASGTKDRQSKGNLNIIEENQVQASSTFVQTKPVSAANEGEDSQGHKAQYPV